MVLVAYAGPVRPAAALRDSVLCLPTDIHSLFVNKPSSSSSSVLLLLLLLLRCVGSTRKHRPTGVLCGPAPLGLSTSC